MTWLTKVYLTIKNLKSPEWLKELTSWLTINVLIPTLKQFTSAQIMKLESLIVTASNKNISGEEKLKWVVGEFKSSFSPVMIKDSLINLAVETLLQRLRVQGIVRF
jgi:hypothetical protein